MTNDAGTSSSSSNQSLIDYLENNGKGKVTEPIPVRTEAPKQQQASKASKERIHSTIELHKAQAWEAVKKLLQAKRIPYVERMRGSELKILLEITVIHDRIIEDLNRGQIQYHSYGTIKRLTVVSGLPINTRLEDVDAKMKQGLHPTQSRMHERSNLKNPAFSLCLVVLPRKQESTT